MPYSSRSIKTLRSQHTVLIKKINPVWLKFWADEVLHLLWMMVYSALLFKASWLILVIINKSYLLIDIHETTPKYKYVFLNEEKQAEWMR